jgi:hypothetical protein
MTAEINAGSVTHRQQKRIELPTNITQCLMEVATLEQHKAKSQKK